MNRLPLMAQLAALEQMMAGLSDEAIPTHTAGCLWRAMNDVADARTVLSLEQQQEERRTGVVTVRGPSRAEVN